MFPTFLLLSSCGFLLPEFSNPLDPYGKNADTFAIELLNEDSIPQDLGVSISTPLAAAWTGGEAVVAWVDAAEVRACAVSGEGTSLAGGTSIYAGTSPAGVRMGGGDGSCALVVEDGGEVWVGVVEVSDGNLQVDAAFQSSGWGVAGLAAVSEPVWVDQERWVVGYVDGTGDIHLVLLDSSSDPAVVVQDLDLGPGSGTVVSLSAAGDGTGGGLLVVWDDDGVTATVIYGISFSLSQDTLELGSGGGFGATLSGIGALPVAFSEGAGAYLLLSTDGSDLQGISVTEDQAEWTKGWDLPFATGVYGLWGEPDGWGLLYEEAGVLRMARKDLSFTSDKVGSPYPVYTYTTGVEAAAVSTGEKYLVFYADTDGVTPGTLFVRE
ncbi:hypothetical protein Spith_0066 [Spirochaeta thermophila DSM 6578]|uniref:Uncharacterized protein n=1 Tax=Winmispira thermophila (strain ATCC 700085 / DSM 6578 / Z-1203) TaxID=869211 RepID=G0GBJ4_WINT7|nr:hypothetical protein Spith_0066 [Spirochaeta thermophila DSM 6578]